MYWTTNGRRIIFVWKWKEDTLKWESHCPKEKRILVIGRSRVRIVPSDMDKVIADLRYKRDHRNHV
jgi:hypothetical protein